ncbi:hypothetical protein Golob_023908 [Gossypium lobatum]|uniref:Uncharacterized protein n=1 Tax=Gossypium lobatum TaxID=34289 RepID=A0A7J8NKD3_9ROSI|nr:hypothetical protein [Gossypium lobatum]
MGVTMKEGVLDPARHTIIVFKENKDSNLTGVVKGSCSKLLGNEAIYLSRFRVDGRASGYRKGMRLKKTIQDWGNIFKNLGNSQVPLSGLVNTMVYLISVQLELDTNKERAVDDVVVSSAMKRGQTLERLHCAIDNDAWRFDGYMSDTLSCLSMEVKKWNRVVYSHIGTRKRHIVNRLADIQKVMERSISNRLVRLEIVVRDELDSVLHHVELLWKQKSRCD